MFQYVCQGIQHKHENSQRQWGKILCISPFGQKGKKEQGSRVWDFKGNRQLADC